MTGNYGFTIKKGDTHKTLKMYIVRENTDGTYTDVNLTGATAKFYMRERGKRDKKINGTACTINLPATGRLYYTFTASNVDTPGVYEAEVVVTFSDTSIETFPEGENIIVFIKSDVES